MRRVGVALFVLYLLAAGVAMVWSGGVLRG